MIMPGKLTLLSPQRHSRTERLLACCIVVAALALAFYLLAYDSFFASIQTPPCMFRTLTGLYCPGCGTRSALIQLAKGNLYAAFRLNPLTVLALPVLVPSPFPSFLRLYGRSLVRLRLHPALIWGYSC